MIIAEYRKSFKGINLQSKMYPCLRPEEVNYFNFLGEKLEDVTKHMMHNSYNFAFSGFIDKPGTRTRF